MIKTKNSEIKISVVIFNVKPCSSMGLENQAKPTRQNSKHPNLTYQGKQLF